MESAFTFVNEYGKYCVPRSSLHRPTAKRILNGGIHEPLTIEFIRDNYSGGDIIHAGAYFGDMLPALSQIVGDLGKVWAFEPNRENYLCATKTIKLNRLRNVHLMNVGLGSYSDNLFLVVRDLAGKALGGGSRIWNSQPMVESFSQLQEFKMKRIDDLIPLEREISIIHLDVEGYEFLAILGSMETIERNYPILILEGDHNSEWADLGYRFLKKVHNNSVLVWGS